MISAQATPLSVVMPSFAQYAGQPSSPSPLATMNPQNPFWNMAGQASASRTATDSRALAQSLHASTAAPAGPSAGMDQASQFALGLVLLVLLLMHW